MIMRIPMQVIARLESGDGKSATVQLAAVPNQDPNSAAAKYFREPANGVLELHSLKSEISKKLEVGSTVDLALVLPGDALTD